jgi:hypothetical protein
MGKYKLNHIYLLLNVSFQVSQLCVYNCSLTFALLLLLPFCRVGDWTQGLVCARQASTLLLGYTSLPTLFLKTKGLALSIDLLTMCVAEAIFDNGQLNMFCTQNIFACVCGFLYKPQILDIKFYP